MEQNAVEIWDGLIFNAMYLLPSFMYKYNTWIYGVYTVDWLSEVYDCKYATDTEKIQCKDGFNWIYYT